MNDGEHIWAKSVLKGFDELGYTVLITESATETNELYAGLSGAVVLVIKTRDEMEKCVESSRKGKLGGCLEGEKNTRGIPVWKVRLKKLPFSRFKSFFLQERRDEANPNSSLSSV